MTQPTAPSRSAIIEVLAANGYQQSRGGAEGFTIDVLDLGQARFRVRYVPPTRIRAAAEAIASMAQPLRSASWQVDVEHEPAPDLIVTRWSGIQVEDHSLVVNDSVSADERNDPEGYVYCARCLRPADALGGPCPGSAAPSAAAAGPEHWPRAGRAASRTAGQIRTGAT